MFVCPHHAISRAKLIGEWADEITEFARQESIDMILKGTHGYNGFDELGLGS